MARFAFAVPPLAGHVNPTLSVGAELIRRGHEVGWISLDRESLQEHLPQGGSILCTEQNGNGWHETGRQYLESVRRKAVYGMESNKFLYEEVQIPLNRYMLPGIIRQIDRFKPDLLINDHLLFAGAVAALKKQVPYATSVATPASVKNIAWFRRVSEWQTETMLRFQKEHGVHAARSVACSERLTLVFTSRKFFGENDLPDYMRFVGPVLHHRAVSTAFDWERFHRPGKHPKILVSIGTTFPPDVHRGFFTRVARAFEGEPVSVVAVSEKDLLECWPSNFLVAPSVPQVALLPYLDAVVCHGGQNTVSEALDHGLPLVVLPVAYDQAVVAGQVADAGSGIRLNFKRFKPEHVRKAVQEVLDQPAYRNAAEEMRLSFRQSGGTGRAAALLEEAATKKLTINNE